MDGHIYNQQAGISSVGQYQMAGTPWVTGSTIDGTTGSATYNGEIMIQFPRVTKSFTIINRSTQAMLIHFDTRANTNVISQHHYVTLTNQYDSFGFDVRCKKVYLSTSAASVTGSFELFAELTGISTNNINFDTYISGSGINEVS